MTNRITVTVETGNLLGSYLRDRRTRLDPAALGFRGGTPANAGAAPGGGRPARQHQPDLVHLAGAGPGRRAFA